jgi:hypothetical protein
LGNESVQSFPCAHVIDRHLNVQKNIARISESIYRTVSTAVSDGMDAGLLYRR